MNNEEIEARRAARREFDALVRRAHLDDSIDAVKAFMGEPHQVTTELPEYLSEGNREVIIRSKARVRPEPPDTFLVYLDPNRPRTLHYFRFRAGRLCAR